MEESILDTVKKNILSYDPSSTDFDEELLVHINGLFLELNQIGAGPENGFSIKDGSATWNEFKTPNLTDEENNLILTSIKQYIILNCKLTFDTPESSTVIDSYKAVIDKHLNRIMWQIDT